MDGLTIGAIISGIISGIIVALVLRYTDNYERVNNSIIRFIFWCFLPSSWNPAERIQKEREIATRISRKHVAQSLDSIVFDLDIREQSDKLKLQQAKLKSKKRDARK